MSMFDDDDHEGGHGGGHERWLVSYADFITLMMVVFMVLYSMSYVDQARYGALRQSLSASMGLGGPFPSGGNPMNPAPLNPGPDPYSFPGAPNPAEEDEMVETPPPPIAIAPEPPPLAPEPEPDPEPEPPPAPPPRPAPTPTPAPPPDPMTPVRERFEASAGARAGQLSVQVQDRGLAVSILASVLFEPHEATLRPGAADILNDVGQELRLQEGSIIIEGGPDAGSAAPWELASQRASAVASYLVSETGLAPGRIAVIGYGENAGVDGLVNVIILRRN